MSDLAAISSGFQKAMLGDRPRLRRRLRAVELAGGAGRDAGPMLDALKADLERSIARRAAREAALPRPKFEQKLPISERREEIARAIQENQVVVLCGETGSGKTTQLPQICLSIGRGAAGMIGHTQPRRIAARTVAARIAEELDSPLGRAVGYKVRFGDKTSSDTFIKVMTDGILLAETRGDRWLEAYDTIIVDEAHERSLNIDFLLGYLRQLLPRRPELRVIVTSATIDPQRFAAHFATGGRPAPVIEVSGRVYPVEVHYRPPECDDPDDMDDAREGALLRAVDELAALDKIGASGATRGDILVFLSGEREIRHAAEALRKHHPKGVEILPLYSRLSVAEQMEVFRPHGARRIVLATNVAETSLTVPGIKYVIDTGLARISRYSARTKVQRLPIEAVSRASADQRKGRCGRVSEGVCIRLYAEEDFKARAEFTDPEILRTNLASVILQMKSLRLGNVEDFPFVEPPDSRMIRDGYETLLELGATDEKGDLTKLGHDLARLPIDPRVGRMILAGHAEGSLAEVLVIAAALTVQDPRERPHALQDKADAAHAKFHDESSDFLAILKMWKFYKEQEDHLSGSKLRKLCHEHFLSYIRMREWDDLYGQLRALVADMGYHPNTNPATYEAVHRALLTGLLSNVGTRGDTFEYTGGRGTKFHIFPGSGLFKKGPRWVMAAEIVQTTRLYARTVAKIDPAWVENLATHVVKRSYSDPHWKKEEGQVCAFERVTLFGLEIASRRRVHYGPIDPAASRELFIHHALVEGDSPARAPFLEHNRTLLEEARRLEAKARAHDIAADAKKVHAFYAARLPRDVYSVPTLEKWRRQAELTDKRALFMSPQDAVARRPEEVTPQRFPDEMPVFGTKLKLDYALEPGEPNDGVTVTVPVEALPQLDERRCEWLVPGMVADKVLALLRSLPKAMRKTLEPMDALARECAAAIPYGEGALADAVAARVKTIKGIAIPREAWQPRGLPEHFSLNVVVLDERGKELGRGRDIAELKSRFGAKARAGFERLAKSSFDKDGLTKWDFGDLPEKVDLKRDGLALTGYPALMDKGSSVSLRMLDSPEASAHATRDGLRRLFILQAGNELAYQLGVAPQMRQMSILAAPLGGGDALKRDLCALIAERAFMEGRPTVRTKAEFESRLSEGWKRIGVAAKEACALVAQILEARQAIDLKLSDRVPAAWGPAVADIREQAARLLPAGLLVKVPWGRLVHYPRYLGAILKRLEKLRGPGVERDARAAGELSVFWRRYADRAEEAPKGAEPAAWEEYRWMLEEYRVSLFAQEMGTAGPVSAKRLDDQWTRVGI